MSKLNVPGAVLHYDLVGEGPLLVFITGAGGDGDFFKPAAEYLKNDFTVLTYDRRGMGKSELVGEQDYSFRVGTDAADVAALIAHVDKGPANVFGSSSGGVVALHFMTAYPDSFTRIVAHEPAAMSILPGYENHLGGIQKTYDAYHEHGLQAAIGGFVSVMMSPSDQKTLMAGAAHRDAAKWAQDMDYWFEHELRQYPRTQFDLEAIHKDVDRLIFAVGDDTQGLPPYAMATIFAEKVGAPVKTLAGGHVGYASFPEAFARDLTGILG